MELLNVAKQILDINSNACLTGSLMLKIRGINLGREPKDIDLLILDYSTNIKFPDSWGEMEAFNLASDGTGAKYKYNDIIIDVMSSSEIPEIINGFKVGNLENLINAKYAYSLQNNEAAKKHYNDLVKLGFKFPKEHEDNLPF